MRKDEKKNQEHLTSNIITIDGITFKTSGNILFQNSTESHFVLADSPLLDRLDCFLEHGMEMFMKKIRS